MTLISGADSSAGGTPFPYPGTGPRVLAAYVGARDLPGPPDTPHIWTLDEWNRYIPTNNHGDPDIDFRLLPLYVHDFPGNAVDDANNMCDAIEDLGWKPNVGRLVCLDIETLVDPPYVSAVHTIVIKRGFRMLVYGSLHYLVQNPPCDGRFAALLTKNHPRALPAGQHVVAQQWQFGDHWDLDVFSEYVWNNCGHGFRRDVA